MVKKFLFLSVALFALNGCSSNPYSSDVYTATQAKQVQRVTYGTVTSVRGVTVQADSDSFLGTVGGAVIGGFLGNTIGDGSGQALATAAGAILGGAVGQSAGNKLAEHQGVEMEIKLDSGNSIVVVQTIKDTLFTVGQRVRLVGHNENVTVSPM